MRSTASRCHSPCRDSAARERRRGGWPTPRSERCQWPTPRSGRGTAVGAVSGGAASPSRCPVAPHQTTWQRGDLARDPHRRTPLSPTAARRVGCRRNRNRGGATVAKARTDDCDCGCCPRPPRGCGIHDCRPAHDRSSPGRCSRGRDDRRGCGCRRPAIRSAVTRGAADRRPAYRWGVATARCRTRLRTGAARRFASRTTLAARPPNRRPGCKYCGWRCRVLRVGFGCGERWLVGRRGHRFGHSCGDRRRSRCDGGRDPGRGCAPGRWIAGRLRGRRGSAGRARH